MNSRVNRKAVKGDVLRLKTFNDTKGFHDPNNPDCAVCLEPGTRLEVTVQRVTVTGYFWNRKRVVAEQIISAMFVQPKRTQHTRRDSLLFTANGSEVGIPRDSTWLLQNLPEGTTAHVVALHDKVMSSDNIDLDEIVRPAKALETI